MRLFDFDFAAVVFLDDGEDFDDNIKDRLDKSCIAVTLCSEDESDSDIEKTQKALIDICQNM